MSQHVGIVGGGIGGLAAATILSLFVMPALYRLAYKEKVPSTQTNAELEEASS